MTTQAHPPAPRTRTGAAAIALGVVAVALVVATVGRWGPDWPAQEFRAWSAMHDGVAAWTNDWYAGTPLIGYSPVYSVLGGIFGASGCGVLAATGTWFGAAGLPVARTRTDRLLFHASVACTVLSALFQGQIPFLAGAACAVWSLRAVLARHWTWAVIGAASCSLCSPLAGALLLITTPALAVRVGLRRTAPVLAATIGIAAAPLLGGASGPFPFVHRVFAWVLLCCAALALLTRDRAAQWLGATYALASTVCFVVDNPVAGNIARLGQLVALPLVWVLRPHLRWRPRPLAALLACAAALWTMWPAGSAALRAWHDPSRNARFYTGLLHYLRGHDPPGGRVEVVFSREHWEAYYVARAFPIARGWERQTDLANNGVLYRPLTTSSYRRWLDDNAIDFVALPNAPLDFGGQAEAHMLARAPGYLIPAWHDTHWRLWRVDHPQPLVRGPAVVRAMGTSSVTVVFSHRGQAVVRIRASRNWRTSNDDTKVAATRDGWLTISAPRRGPVTVRTDLDIP